MANPSRRIEGPLQLVTYGAQEGLPVPSSGLGEQAKPWMAKRSGHAESRGREGRGERPLGGTGNPDPQERGMHDRSSVVSAPEPVTA